MAEAEGSSEQDDVSFLRTVSLIKSINYLHVCLPNFHTADLPILNSKPYIIILLIDLEA